MSADRDERLEEDRTEGEEARDREDDADFTDGVEDLDERLELRVTELREAGEAFFTAGEADLERETDGLE